MKLKIFFFLVHFHTSPCSTLGSSICGLIKCNKMAWWHRKVALVPHTSRVPRLNPQLSACSSCACLGFFLFPRNMLMTTNCLYRCEVVLALHSGPTQGIFLNCFTIIMQNMQKQDAARLLFLIKLFIYSFKHI